MKKTFHFILLYSIICSLYLSKVQAQAIGLNFDGINDYVSTSYVGISGNAPRTIEAWIKTTKDSQPTVLGGLGQSVLVDWGGTPNGQRFTFNLLWNNAIRLEVAGNGLSGTIAVNDGQWHHVAVSYNPTAVNTVSLYVDGVLDVAGNLTVGVNTLAFTTLKIGERIDGINRFQGDMDEVRVFNYARSQAQIQATMNTQLCANESGLVAYFKFNEGVPGANNAGLNSVTEYVAGNNGTLQNFALSGTTSNWSNGALSVGGNSSATLNIGECSSYITPSQNDTLTTSGVYYDTIPNAAGCDSIITVNLTISQSFSSFSRAVCDSFISSNGTVYYSSATIQDTLVNGNAFGCDSIMTIALTVSPSILVEEDLDACDSVMIWGVQYYSSQIIDSVFMALGGCDSTHRINLNINQSSPETFLTATSCHPLDTGYASLTLTNASGCDSVVTTYTSLLPTASSFVVIETCDSIEIGGVWYYSSGSVADTLIGQAANACDSIVNYSFNILNSTVTNIDLEACDSAFVFGQWYDSSQVIVQTFTAANFCDSVVVVDLEVNSINYDIIINDWTLELTYIPNTTYTWYSCEDSSFVSSDTTGYFNPGFTGDFYAVIEVNACSFSSECYTVIGEGIIELNYRSNFDLFPNPNQGSFIVSFTDGAKANQLSILSVDGKIVLSKELNSVESFNVDEPLVAGFYMIVFETNQGIYAKKLLIH